MAIPLHGPNAPWLGLGGQSQASDQEKMAWQDDQGWEGNAPVLGKGIGWSSTRGPLPQTLSQCQSPFPNLQQSHPTNEWLSHSMEDLHIQLRSHKSWSRAWWDDAPTPTEEKPKRKKQVRFDVDEELGNDPTLPWGLTLFLAEGIAEEQDDIPSPSTPVAVDSLQLPPSKGPQCYPTYVGQTQPKVPAKPSAGWCQSKPQ